jgi:hypothetical protein
VALNPIAAIQDAAGLGCGAAGAAHPNAETDFRKVVVTADRGALNRALEAELVALRPSCRNVPEGAIALPDTVIHFDSVVLTLGCPTGRQAYYITVKWAPCEFQPVVPVEAGQR